MDSLYSYRTADDSIKIVWRRGKDTTVVAFYDNGSIPDLSPYVKYSDTSAMLAPYLLCRDTNMLRYDLNHHTHDFSGDYLPSYDLGSYSHYRGNGIWVANTSNGEPGGYDGILYGENSISKGGVGNLSFLIGGMNGHGNGIASLYGQSYVSLTTSMGNSIAISSINGIPALNGVTITTDCGGASTAYQFDPYGVISRSGYASGNVLWSGGSYNDLSTSGKIGTGSSQVAAGNHSHSSLSCSGSVNGFTITSTYEGASTTYKFDPFGAISWSGYGTGTVLPAGGAYNDIIGTGLTLHGQCGSGYSNYFAMGDHTHAGLGGTVYEITAGAGMSFSTINYSGSIAMGTPSTVTAYTSNSVSGTTHTHAITGFQEAFTVNLPLTYSSPTLSIGQASTSGSGYLSSTDWNTFNGKADKSSVSMTITVVTNTKLEYREGYLKYYLSHKTRTITVTYGIITSISDESDWVDVGVIDPAPR